MVPHVLTATTVSGELEQVQACMYGMSTMRHGIRCQRVPVASGTELCSPLFLALMTDITHLVTDSNRLHLPGRCDKQRSRILRLGSGTRGVWTVCKLQVLPT